MNLKKGILLLAVISIISACKKEQGELVLPNGYKYEIFQDETGIPAVPGMAVTMHLEIIDDFGNILDDSRSAPIIPSFVVPEANSGELQRNPLLSLVEILSPGDSAAVYVPIDSLPNPPQEFMQSKILTYKVKMITVENADDYRRKMHKKQDETQKLMAALGDAVEKEAALAISAYQEGSLQGRLVNKNLGMKVLVLNEGHGEKAAHGERVDVHYYGFFEDGSSFDNSYKVGKPYSLYIGKGGAIQGWMAGVPEVGEGGTAILDIPYQLAYGDQGNPPVIPPNTDLLFYIKVDKVYKQQ